MPPALRTRRLDADELDKALTLLGIHAEDKQVAEWGRLIGQPGAEDAANALPCGIVAVEDMRGYILGLFCFRVLASTPFGRMLDCDHFIVPDMVRSGLLFTQLTQAAESLAREYRCDRVRLAIPDLDSIRSHAANRFRTALHESGYRLDCLRFEKKLGEDARS